MRFFQILLSVVPFFLIPIGTDIAFDKHFVPLSTLSSHPLFVIIINVPTVFFLSLTLVQLLQRRVWPAVAFAFGLICTGFVHQWVADGSYGNPGYMVPLRHLAAPLASIIAYLVSFLVVWIVVGHNFKTEKLSGRRLLQRAYIYKGQRLVQRIRLDRGALLARSNLIRYRPSTGSIRCRHPYVRGYYRLTSAEAIEFPPH